MLKKVLITAAFFVLFAIIMYYSLKHPIVGDITNDNWIMDITVISGTQTYRAVVYNTVINGTTTHIETIWSDESTWVYTLTLTKKLTTTTTTTLTQITRTTTETTTIITATTTTITTRITTTLTSTLTHPVTVSPPSTVSSIITATSKIVAFDWRSVVVWASIVYTDKTVIGYTTFFYKTHHDALFCRRPKTLYRERTDPKTG